VASDEDVSSVESLEEHLDPSQNYVYKYMWKKYRHGEKLPDGITSPDDYV
jgi:hypothetical protein